MDLLEEPEIKSTYNKCKYIVKVWEHNFKKSHGRLPSKLDIRESSKEVRNAYKKYFQLKITALEQSFKDVDGFNSDDEVCDKQPNLDEESTNIQANLEPPECQKEPEKVAEVPKNTWGFHLDKKSDKTEEKTENKGTPNLNSSFAQKLFCGSKFSKRNPRKSLSFTHKKSEGSADSPNFLSQPSNSSCSETSQLETPTSFKGLFSNKSVKIVNAAERVFTQPTNIVQSVLDNNYKTLKSVDSGWLKRVGQSSGVVIENEQSNFDQGSHLSYCNNLDYNSDDIIDNSDEETSFNLGHSAKRLKTSYSSMQRLGDNLSTTSNSVLANLNTSTVSSELDCKSSNVIKDNVGELRINDRLGTKENDTLKETEINMVINVPTEENKTAKNDKTCKKEPKRKDSQNIRRSSRTTKVKANMAESNSENEDPYHSDNNSDDPEFNLSDNGNKKKLLAHEYFDKEESSTKKTAEKNKRQPAVKKTPKNKERKRTPKKTEKEETEDSTTYELEYSIKPRASAPRFRNLKKLIKTQTSSTDPSEVPQEKEPVIKNKRQQLKDKLEKKIEAGNLNENFITINLKKKIYSRGKKNINFSRYKKQQWKNKKKALAGPDMDMGGCDGGELTCFNCGQTGHFARNCRKTEGDLLLPLEAAEEEPSACPTLEEAAQMAKESVLAIRKPNLCVKDSNVDETLPGDEADTENSEDELFDDVESEKLLAETLKLEEEVAKLDLQMYLDYVRVVEPYYKLNEDGGMIDTPDEVFSALNKFGHSSFRPGQEQAVMRILSGKSTLVTLSTGSGKSLCYQLPAYLYSRREPCISLVISPLVSLMEDQVTGIPSFLKAACLHTNQTKVQREKIMEAISSGNLNVLLVSPEAVVAGEKSSGFGSLLRKLPPIAFACIDEAHCVSQWSHNFRPSYLMICRVLRERMGVKTVLGLTATATRATSDSIINHLQIPDGKDGVISDIPLPDNLILTVSKDHQRESALLGLITSERFSDCKSIIVYCTRREECERITKYLRTSLQYDSNQSKKRKRVSVQAEPYHAGLSASRRRTIQKAFMSGELRIVVATVAFGMGINKSDIRAVIHYNMPKNFESYVQEIGRAGRDGLPAHCHLFLDSKGNDENELRRHIHANSIDRHVIRKLLQRIFLPCSCKGTCPKHEVAFSIEETVRALDLPEENISTLLCYLELHQNKYIELLSPAYTRCKIVSYGGPLQIRKAAKECPPLAMALALQKNEAGADQNVLEFAVVDIAAAVGWDSGICKHKLKNLEWTAVNGQPKRSVLNVQFSNLGFRLLAPGNLSDDQLDEALDSLHEHVVKQEKMSLLQLRAVHQTLIQVASSSYKSCLSQEPSEGSHELKTKIREYFESPNPLDSISLTETKIFDEDLLVNNIRGLITMYRDNTFTGRAVARIFHGIMSPNYPAVIWGRCKYWRSHLNVDFHTICRIATREILNFR